MIWLKIAELALKQQSITHSYYVSLLSEFRIITMFGSSLPPVLCRRDHGLFMLYVILCV